LCQEHKKQYAAAFRFYAAAFTAQPKLADDLDSQHRYNAACAAVFAGCGQGEDAANLDDKERARVRQQALTWLRADLARYAEFVNKGPDQARAAVTKTLRHWQQDTDLRGRTRRCPRQLPESERQLWQNLWAEVETLRQRHHGTTSPQGFGSALRIQMPTARQRREKRPVRSRR